MNDKHIKQNEIINERLKPLADKIYNEFVNDISFVGLNNLYKKYKMGSKTSRRITNILYEKHGKENVKKIFRYRLAKKGGVAFSKSGYKQTHTEKEKRKKSLEKYWENNNEAREKSKRSMIKYCIPKCQSEETKKKRIESRRSGKGWSTRTEEQKKKFSNATSDRWNNGKYDNRKPTLKSKGQLEVIKCIKQLGYDVEDEFRITTKPYDIFIRKKNLIIEFNGTYWHLDPRFYDKDYYDKTRKCYAKNIWKKDIEKLDKAKQMGYTVLVIWQNDWENQTDKNSYLNEVLNGTTKQ